jgi:hypothetical protein
MTTTLLTPSSTAATTTSATRTAPVAVFVFTTGAALVAAAATTAYGAVAIAIHGSMQVGDPGASTAAGINAFSFGIGTLMSSALGVAVAVLIARYAAAPARRWTQVSVALLAVSLVFPLAASHTDNATRLTLTVAHLVAGAIIIPTVRRRFSH